MQYPGRQLKTMYCATPANDSTLDEAEILSFFILLKLNVIAIVLDIAFIHKFIVPTICGQNQKHALTLAVETRVNLRCTHPQIFR